MLIHKSRFPISEIMLVGFLPSFLKVILYKLKGYKIGNGVHIGLGTVIIGKHVEIGQNTDIGFLSIIRGTDIKLGRFVKIGSTTIIDTDKIEIKDDVTINEQVFIGGLSGPDSSIEIGKRARIMQMTFINTFQPISIGDDSGVGGHCLIFTHGSWLSQLEGYPVKFAPVTIGQNVWLPWRVFVLPGVNIGNNVVISANSLVTKDIPSNCLAAGSPAKIISKKFPPPISEEERQVLWGEIVMEFCRFVEYHGFVVEKSEESDVERLIIKNGRTIGDITIINKKSNNATPIYEDNLIIINNIATDATELKSKMVIDLNKKERIGSSNIGEEFVMFIGRYGVRFNRID